MKTGWMGLAMAMALAGCASSRPDDYIDHATPRDAVHCEDEAYEEGLSPSEQTVLMQACLDDRGYRRYRRGH